MWLAKNMTVSFTTLFEAKKREFLSFKGIK